jgi:hypothetical protein
LVGGKTRKLRLENVFKFSTFSIGTLLLLSLSLTQQQHSTSPLSYKLNIIHGPDKREDHKAAKNCKRQIHPVLKYISFQSVENCCLRSTQNKKLKTGSKNIILGDILITEQFIHLF